MTEEAVQQEATEAPQDTQDVRDPGLDNSAGSERTVEPLGPPEWLPDKFWKDGEVNAEALAKSYTHLEQKLGKPVEVPESYERPEVEGIDFESKVLTDFNTDAKELGLTQDQYAKVVAKYGPLITDPEAAEAAESQRLEMEYKALGPDADKRIDGLLNYAKNNLGKEDAAVIEEMLTKADYVRVLERMAQGNRDARLPRRVEGIAQGLDANKLKEMMAAKTANGQRRMSVDPQYRKEVERAYAEVYGTAPAEQIVSSIG